MTDLSYQHKATLPDRGDGKRRHIWHAPATDTHVRIHIEPRDNGFGSPLFVMTGSIAEPDGRVMRDASGAPLLHRPDHPHHFQIESFEATLDGPAPSAEEIAAKMKTDFLAQQRFIVARVEEWATKRRVAAAL